MGNGDMDELRALLVGNTIESVDKPDRGVSEAVCKLTVRKDGKAHEFHLHATDLGWWVGEHKSLRELPDGTLAPAWEDFNGMVESMTDHLASAEMDDWPYGESPFESRDDSLTRAFGFCCQHTGKEWWATLSAAKALGRDGILSTQAKRAEVASFLGRFHRVPQPDEMGSITP